MKVMLTPQLLPRCLCGVLVQVRLHPVGDSPPALCGEWHLGALYHTLL